MLVLNKTALALIGFYLVIASNFLKELVGCRLQNLLDSNMYVKHLLGFLLLFILVILVNPENADLKFIQLFGLSVFVYLWFIITTRSHYIFIIITLILLTIVYIFESKKTRLTEEKKEKEKEIIEKRQNILIIISIMINIVGFLIYYFEKKREYGRNFRFNDFIIGNIKCKKYTPKYAKIV